MAFSYQHEYHAGNFADLQKHVCLTEILGYLCKKDKPITVIDMHGGSGIYNTEDEKLLKTGEAEAGIKKLYSLYQDRNIPFPQDIKDYLEKETPYLAENLYAGSPELERLYLREKDAHFVIEKHPQASAKLSENMTSPLHTAEGETRARAKTNVIVKDSYEAMKSLVPPLVKRGLILCDPSYEDVSDYRKVTDSLIEVHRKWSTAVIAVWYPLILRHKNETNQMLSSLENAVKMSLNPGESFRCEMVIKDPETFTAEDQSHLYGSGMFVINPPWTLKENLEKACRFIEKLYNLF